MAEFELPRNLAREAADWPVGRRREWLDALPGTAEDLAARWSLRLGRPYQPGGVTSWVAPARNAVGESVVLKIGLLHDEALHEAEGLRAWNGNGAVRVLDSLATGQNNVLLLEACQPGTALSQALPVLARDTVVASLLRRLWIEPAEGHPFRTLQSMCDAWADEFEEDVTVAQGHGLQLDPGMIRDGLELFRRLPGTSRQSVLLCTDLHPDNVLAATREPWLVIDPKPYIGDPTYDPVQHMLNFPDRLATDARGFALRMADLCGLDVDRLRQWLFARCVLEVVTQPLLTEAATALAE